MTTLPTRSEMDAIRAKAKELQDELQSILENSTGCSVEDHECALEAFQHASTICIVLEDVNFEADNLPDGSESFKEGE